MKLATALIAAALAFAPVAAMADDAASCTNGDPVSLLVQTAKDQNVELVTYTGDDFTKYVEAVHTLFPAAGDFGNGADEIIEALLDENTVAVFLANEGCLIASGEVSRAGRDKVLAQAGLNQ